MTPITYIEAAANIKINATLEDFLIEKSENGMLVDLSGTGYADYFAKVSDTEYVLCTYGELNESIKIIIG